MTMTLDHLLQRHAKYRGDCPAVLFEDQDLNWREFDAYCKRIAAALVASGLKKGDKIVTVLPNCLELLALYWAVTRVGGVVVPLSPLLNTVGIIKLVRACDALAVVASEQHADQLAGQFNELGLDTRLHVVSQDSDADTFSEFVQNARPVDLQPPSLKPDDLFNIVYSSGTTGEPKGIEHSHLVRSQYGAHFAASFRMTPESVVLHTGSIVFNGAFVTLMPTFFLGARYILHRYFDVAELLKTVREQQVTHVMMVPAQIIALLEHPETHAEDLESLEMVLSLGAPLYQDQKEHFERLLPGRLYELYGLTEGFVTILDKFDVAAKPGSVGCPPPGYRMRIVDNQGEELPRGEIGEIVGDGPIRMSGYYQRPDLTSETVQNGWIHTGDLGFVDEDGFLYLVDRKKDMIITGGVNVYPRDIEDIVITHPQVMETAVFGAPSDKWGETPVAAVLLRENESITETALADWINERVDAKFQRVSEVLILDDFPRNAAGKTLKREIRDSYINRTS